MENGVENEQAGAQARSAGAAPPIYTLIHGFHCIESKVIRDEFYF